MGKIIEKVLVKNFSDIANVQQTLKADGKIREANVEAVVDTGATYLCLPPDVIEELGLLYSHTRDVKTTNGNVKRRIFRSAEITIRDRSITQSVMENDRNTPALIGYLVLEEMDFVANPKERKLIANPAHDGKWVMDLYYKVSALSN